MTGIPEGFNIDWLEDLNVYQQLAEETAIYPEDKQIFYPAMGLAGEAGEVLNKLKKVWRDNKEPDLDAIRKEIGDCLWYVALLCRDSGTNLQQVAYDNIMKLHDRQARGVLGGSGDGR